jgi:hypothetical protein
MTTDLHETSLSSVAQSCIGALALALLSVVTAYAADTINGQVLVGKAPLATTLAAGQ